MQGVASTSAENAPAVSVIIPAFNAEATLHACLQALREQATACPPFEVIVVDDGSPDRTSAVAESFGAHVERIPHSGRATARNQGSRAAAAPLLFFTDADCIPASDWVARLSEPFADASVAGARGVYRSRQRSLVARFVQLEYEDKYRRLEPMQDIDFVDTYSAAYRKETLLQHGGFDPSLRFDEDQELSFRLANRGLRLVFAPEAVVYHQHPDSLGAYFKKKLGTGYWKAAVILRYPSKLARDTHTPPSQRFELALLYATLGLAIAAGLGAISPWFPVGGALALTASTLTFAVRAAHKDRAVGFVAPTLLWARALALGAGFAAGVVRFLPGRLLRR